MPRARMRACACEPEGLSSSSIFHYLSLPCLQERLCDQSDACHVHSGSPNPNPNPFPCLQERLFDQSDAYRVHVCERSGLIAVANLKKQQFSSQIYKGDSNIVQVRGVGRQPGVCCSFAAAAGQSKR